MGDDARTVQAAFDDDPASAEVTIEHRVRCLELMNERPTPKCASDLETTVIGSGARARVATMEGHRGR